MVHSLQLDSSRIPNKRKKRGKPIMHNDDCLLDLFGTIQPATTRSESKNLLRKFLEVATMSFSALQHGSNRRAARPGCV